MNAYPVQGEGTLGPTLASLDSDLPEPSERVSSAPNPTSHTSCCDESSVKCGPAEAWATGEEGLAVRLNSSEPQIVKKRGTRH